MASFSGWGAKGGMALAAVVVAALGAAGFFALRSGPQTPVPVVPGVLDTVSRSSGGGDVPVQSAPDDADRAGAELPVAQDQAPEAPPPTASPVMDAPQNPAPGLDEAPVDIAAIAPTSPRDSDLASDPATNAESADDTPAPSDADPILPGFDLVRIDPDGSALIAGHAEPGAGVAVLLDGDEIGSSEAGSDGDFVAMFDIIPAAMPRLLALRATLGDTVRESRETVIVAPLAEPEFDLAQAVDVEPEPTGTAVPVMQKPLDVAKDGGALDLPAAAPDDAAPSGLDEAPVPADLARTAPEDALPPPVETEVAAVAPGKERVRSEGQTAPPAVARPDAVLEPPRQSAVPRESEGMAGLPEAPSGSPDVAKAARPVPPGVATAGPEQAAPDRIVALPAAPQAAPAPSGAAAPGSPEFTDAPAAPLSPADAPRVLVADDHGVRVIQESRPSPAAQQSISIDAITYDASGDVVLSGRGAPAAGVQVYLDNAPVRSAPIGPDGQWRIDLPKLETRVYTLRVDEIASDGRVRSRSETPFRPEPADVVAARRADADPDAPLAVVTVQPGFTLWRIARENYGEGMLYVRVFEANVDKIRDPDLIYPGQIFDVPK